MSLYDPNTRTLFSRLTTGESSRDSTSRGFTLIEVLVVIVMIVLISAFASTRIAGVSGWKNESDIRKFANLLDLLRQDTSLRGESYRLIFDLDNSSYYVRQEILPAPSQFLQVDYLKNLRTKKEQQRRQQQELALDEEDREQQIKEAYNRADARENAPLEQQFFQTILRDPNSEVKLEIPLEFPHLAQAQQLSASLRFRDITVDGTEVQRGTTYMRFSPRKPMQQLLVHFSSESNEVFTLAAEGGTFRVRILAGDLTFVEAFSSQYD